MIEKILFDGFGASVIIYGIITVLVKVVLHKSGYRVPLFNSDFSDYKKLHSLAKQEHKYRVLYFIYVLLTILPLIFFIASFISTVSE